MNSRCKRKFANSVEELFRDDFILPDADQDIMEIFKAAPLRDITTVLSVYANLACYDNVNIGGESCGGGVLSDWIPDERRKRLFSLLQQHLESSSVTLLDWLNDITKTEESNDE